MNEVFEFLAAASIPGMAIGDGANTGWDLAFNLAGVVAAAVWLATAGVARRTPAAGSEPARPTTVAEPRLDGPGRGTGAVGSVSTSDASESRLSRQPG